MTIPSGKRLQRERKPDPIGEAARTPWSPAVHEWLAIMRDSHLNGLLVAAAPVTDAALDSLMPRLEPPVLERWNDGTPWDDEHTLCTLILHDVLALSPREQHSLLAWMNGHGGGCRVVSVSCLPVFPLVEDGGFLAPLYYRLNVIYAEDRGVLQ